MQFTLRSFVLLHLFDCLLTVTGLCWKKTYYSMWSSKEESLSSYRMTGFPCCLFMTVLVASLWNVWYHLDFQYVWKYPYAFFLCLLNRRASLMPVRTASWKLLSELRYRKHILIPHKPSRRVDQMRNLSQSFFLEVKSSFLFADLRRRRNRRILPSWGSLHTKTWGTKKRKAGGLSLSPLQGLSLGQHQIIGYCPALMQGSWRSQLTSLKVCCRA